MQVASELAPVLCPQPLTRWSLVVGPGWVFAPRTGLGSELFLTRIPVQCHSSLHYCLAIPGTNVDLG